MQDVKHISFIGSQLLEEEKMCGSDRFPFYLRQWQPDLKLSFKKELVSRANGDHLGGGISQPMKPEEKQAARGRKETPNHTLAGEEGGKGSGLNLSNSITGRKKCGTCHLDLEAFPKT